MDSRKVRHGSSRFPLICTRDRERASELRRLHSTYSADDLKVEPPTRGRMG